MEPGQRLLLPPAGGRRDAGAGGRVRARHRRAAVLDEVGAPGRSSTFLARSRRADVVLRQRGRAVHRGVRRSRARSAVLWDDLLRSPSVRGSRRSRPRRLRYGVQVNSLGLTEAQPENNVPGSCSRPSGSRCAATRVRGPCSYPRGTRRWAAAAVGPAVVAAHPAGAGPRDRPAAVCRHLRGVARHGGPRRRAALRRPRRDGARGRAGGAVEAVPT